MTKDCFSSHMNSHDIKKLFNYLNNRESELRKNSKDGNLLPFYVNNTIQTLIEKQEKVQGLITLKNSVDEKKIGGHLIHTAESYYYLSGFENRNENLKKSLEKRMEAIKWFTEDNLRNNLINNYVEIGNTYYNTGRYEESIKYYNTAAFLARMKNRKKPLEKNNIPSVVIYKIMYNNAQKEGDLKNSVKFRMKALREIKKEDRNLVQLAFSYFNIGNNCKALNNYDKALSYFEISSKHINQAIDDGTYNTSRFPISVLEEKIATLEKLKV